MRLFVKKTSITGIYPKYSGNAKYEFLEFGFKFYSKWLKITNFVDYCAKTFELTHYNGFNWFNFLKLGFTPCMAEESQQGMELQEKETQKD